jgi:hypothetical protein
MKRGGEGGNTYDETMLSLLFVLVSLLLVWE